EFAGPGRDSVCRNRPEPIRRWYMLPVPTRWLGGRDMRLIIRPLAALFLVLASVAALPLSWTLSGVVVALTSNTTALIMGGSFHPLAEPADAPPFVTAYLGNAVTGHLDPAFADASGPVTNAVAVYTPEQFFPIG